MTTAAQPASGTSNQASPQLTPATKATKGVKGEAVRVGGTIRTPTKVRDIKPVYPQAAMKARAQGVVIIEATIGPDGTVKAARILRSIPLLDEPALDAVKQWQCTPALINGVPSPVIMTVTVRFTLGR